MDRLGKTFPFPCRVVTRPKQETLVSKVSLASRETDSTSANDSPDGFDQHGRSLRSMVHPADRISVDTNPVLAHAQIVLFHLNPFLTDQLSISIRSWELRVNFQSQTCTVSRSSHFSILLCLAANLLAADTPLTGIC